jgi:hypothetical protein
MIRPIAACVVTGVTGWLFVKETREHRIDA